VVRAARPALGALEPSSSNLSKWPLRGRRHRACRLRGEHEEAETLDRPALTIALETAATLDQPEDLRLSLRGARAPGKTNEARDHRDRALEPCELKEACAAYFKRRLDAVVGAAGCDCCVPVACQ